MTKQYDNNLKGVLFKNDEKEEDTHPDYRGSATVDGVDFFLDAWINTAESGRKYMSLRFKKKEKQGSKPTAKTTAKGRDADDDIPF